MVKRLLHNTTILVIIPPLPFLRRERPPPSPSMSNTSHKRQHTTAKKQFPNSALISLNGNRSLYTRQVPHKRRTT